MTDTKADQAAIAVLAYGFWEAEGGPHGRDKDHWFMAEKLVTGVPKDEGTTAGSGETSPTAVRSAERETMARPPATWSTTHN